MLGLLMLLRCWNGLILWADQFLRSVLRIAR
jgi:hypothetical protein